MEAINGKYYHFWQQFIDMQNQFIGGFLEDCGDSIDRSMGSLLPAKTKITGIQIRPNGKDSAFFEVLGEKFSCGFDVHHGGVIGGLEGWITFSGYGGHTWRIKEKQL